MYTSRELVFVTSSASPEWDSRHAHRWKCAGLPAVGFIGRGAWGVAECLTGRGTEEEEARVPAPKSRRRRTDCEEDEEAARADRR
jgi:hypothetical protein